MLCYVMLCYVMLCYVMLCYNISYINPYRVNNFFSNWEKILVCSATLVAFQIIYKFWIEFYREVFETWDCYCLLSHNTRLYAPLCICWFSIHQRKLTYFKNLKIVNKNFVFLHNCGFSHEGKLGSQLSLSFCD